MKEKFFFFKKKKNHFVKCCKVKKVKHIKKYHDSLRSDGNSQIFKNEALFIGPASNEDFAPFDNDNKWTANLGN